MGGDVGYIRLKQFQQTSTAEISQALHDFRSAGPLRGVVLGKGINVQISDGDRDLTDAADTIQAFDTEGYVIRIACEVKDFNPKDWMDRKAARRMARSTQFSVAATKQALADANFEITPENSGRVGVVINTGGGGGAAAPGRAPQGPVCAMPAPIAMPSPAPMPADIASPAALPGWVRASAAEYWV